jgi:hypothetical protein
MPMPDLFDWTPPPDLTRMHRRPDHDTSIAAAAEVFKFRSDLQREIYEVFLTDGAMTDGELEAMERFTVYGPSTVRKRRSELFQAGLLRKTGERRGGMNVWEIDPKEGK